MTTKVKKSKSNNNKGTSNSVKKNGKASKSKSKTSYPKNETSVLVIFDTGYGNDLYIRGSGSELNWDKGILMANQNSDEWLWSSDNIREDVECKFLINDEIWEVGDNVTITAGEIQIYIPKFQNKQK